MKAILSLAVLALIGAVDIEKKSKDFSVLTSQDMVGNNKKGDLAWNNDEDDESYITGEQNIAHVAFDTEMLRGLSSSKVQEPDGTLNGMLPLTGA